MAVAELNVSRRALLGAAFAIPAGFAPSPSLSRRRESSSSPKAEVSWTPAQIRGDENWRKALARLRRAEAAVNAAAGEPDEDRYGDLLVVFNHALRKLVRTPAPDLRAFALKIGLAVDHEVAELTGGHACLAALKRDAARLCLRA